MKKLIALIITLLVLTPTVGFAGTTDILTSLQTARGKLVALLGATDKGAQTALVQEIKTATQDVDKNVATTLADPATSPDLKGKLSEFKTIWTDFQKTRDTEIIPAVLAGDKDKAKGLAQGIQVERFKKMAALLQ
jgi:hypothetical protein